ncbi:hypothetical protein JL09_g570 [Pichia kudriavzevii]|uniref:3-hydroxy-3-methylglutaryl coenzyme A reductase n=1 Tax=Pichia kudriavzevii TaxID=4909 RepID=A0A099P7C1_PICKU|nr:hypothetical protein JL09_g570 [Pichia kudriavzevii]
MTYLFSDIPASLARVCANKPIHIIISTVLFAAVAYLGIFEQYITNDLPATDSQEVNFYCPPSSSNWELLKSTSDLDKYSNAEHVYLNPLKFKGSTDSFPEFPNLIEDLETSDVDGYVLTDTAVGNLPEVLKNEQGQVFKLRSSNNKLGKYYEYCKSIIVKLQHAIVGAEPLDIVMVLCAYVAMWFTFIQLFYGMRKIGSNFWLAFGSILSSCFAFIFALALTTEILKIKVSLVSLTEGLPFLVSTIGFKHKLAFTAPVVKALNSDPHKDVADIISDVVRSRTAIPLIRDQLIISASFIICSLLVQNLPGLKNFCILASIILAVDLFFTFTFFASILSLKAQIFKVHREIELKEILEEDGISSNVANNVAEVSIDISQTVLKNNRRILGFKIFTVFGFLGLHLFALGTSWLYDDSADFEPIANRDSHLLIAAVKNTITQIPNNGLLLTVLPIKVYSQATALTELEYYVVLIFTTLTTAISDPLISKFLFMIAGISVSINIYLLNATRFHIRSPVSIINQLNSSKPNSSVGNDIVNASTTTSKPSKKTKKKTKKRAENNIQEPLVADVNADNIKEGQIVDENSTADDDSLSENTLSSSDDTVRPLEELTEILKAGNVKDCNNSEVLELVIAGKLPLYALEKQLGNKMRAVVVRRQSIAKFANAPVLLSDRLPFKDYDYDRVFGACCENVIGYVPIPVGVAGPLVIDGKPFHIPVATTEGCLVASAMRGCKAINAGGGVETVLTADGMTRGPCVQFPNLKRAGKAKVWLDSEEGQKKMKAAFNSTSRFARLQHIKTAIAGDSLYIRFKTTTGDAMGMNMISKGVEHSLKCMAEEFGFDDMNVISLSGNYCIDKKAAAINWIEGRGKSIVASADIPSDIVEKVLKSNVDALVELNVSKNLVGSALAGAIGGFNAHAANLLTAIYIATGQDPAQNVESSNCMTLMKKLPNGDLRISVSMPSIEVGTIGGGTVLEPQGAMLELLGIRGPHPTEPGANARQLAKVIASAVLASELSLCSALAAGHLVQSHMQHNRKAPAPLEAVPSAGVSLNSADVERLKEGSKICIRS